MNEKAKNINEEVAASVQEYSPEEDFNFQRFAVSEKGVDIKKRIIEFSKLMSYYKCAIMEIETKLNVLNVEYSLSMDRNPISSVESRIKSLPSITEKLEIKGIVQNIENIEKELNDIAGIRVICSFTDDVYLIADALLKQDDIVLIEKKDYIENPKPNGYRSLHLIVSVPIFLAQEKRIMKVEIQLRNIAMDFWASLEHQLHYKKDFEFTEEMKRELYECATMSAELDARMDALRNKALGVNDNRK